jgi:hypothetical protein
VEIRISVSMSEKFLPQLPYNERSQGSQGFTIPPQAALIKRETCLRSCHPRLCPRVCGNSYFGIHV